MQSTASRTVIVTGAAHGIGAGIARHLAAKGWRVACIDTDAEAATQIAGEIGGAGIGGDVSSEADVERMVAVARTRLGRIDALVANAGISKFGSLAETSLETWNHVLAVNLTSTFLLARTLAGDLKAARGAMVTIASIRAHMSEADTLAYSASKGGLVALTHALAISMAPHVRVNCISPGWIEVEDWQKASKAKAPKHSKADKDQHPVGRVGIPDDIAQACQFLTESADFMTGQNIILDGGMSVKMIYA